ncbi:hypothetical protein BDD12DRAFT_892616 [Trichophaea hybrida]|nr:hypothetical protein BDD12DRAFT_892616 [Trichophaea hybrida]
MVLHSYNVIHGDIKPQNVLVFKDATGTTFKMADFGYSTLATGETGKVLLPKSRPWNAPEHNFGEFTVGEAKKTDVYSFGMLCLWILFRDNLPGIPQITAEGTPELISFDAPFGRCTLLEQLKNEDKVLHAAIQFIESMVGMHSEITTCLKEFFSLALPLNPEARTSDFGRLVGFLHQKSSEPQLHVRTLETTREFSNHADFRIAENLDHLMDADYRVRTQIRESLENNYIRNQNQPFADDIAFQVAFCYHIGFGVKSDENTCNMWLEKSNKQLNDLRIAIDSVQPAKCQREGIRGQNSLVKVDLIHEYRRWGLNKLQQAREQCEREVIDMTRNFGELHFIPLKLLGTIGTILDALGELTESKVLRMRIRDQIVTIGGSAHPCYIEWTAAVLQSHMNLGEWMEALQLQQEIVNSNKNALISAIESIMDKIRNTNNGQWYGAQKLQVPVTEIGNNVLRKGHPHTLASMNDHASMNSNQGRWAEAENLFVQVIETIKSVQRENPVTLSSSSNLAVVFSKLGRWTEAEELFVQVMETFKRVLGEEHPDTLASMNNLALTYGNQGRWTEAEELEVQVMETFKRVLGEEHPDTLGSMNNLASTYRNQGRWTEAEELFVQVMETRKRVLGEEHPDTLGSMNNLASTYRNQGRWTEAEELFVQVMETRKRVLGEEHPDTLGSMNNLASIFWNQGRWTEAEELEVQVMETFKRVLGEEHPDTLGSMNNLASTYRNQGRWTEAEELFVQVMETRKRVLGEEHPDTLGSMNNIASTFWNQGRWTEAEELEVQVMERRKRVLGEEHPDTLGSVNNLASTYRNQGRWTEAEELFVQVMETFKRVLGEEHPDTLGSMNNLASTYGNQGRWTEAEELFVQVMETRKRVLGEEHPDTLTSLSNLATRFWN